MVTTEEIKAPRIVVSRNGISAERVIRLETWADVNEYIESLTGVEFVAGNVIQRTNPTTFPGKPWLPLEGIEIEGFDPEFVGAVDADSLATAPGGARVTIRYKTLDYNLVGGVPSNDDPDLPDVPFLTHDISLSVEMLPVPRSTFRWDLDGAGSTKDVSPDVSIPYVIGLMSHRLSWKNVPQPPWSAIRTAYGKTNEALFLGHEAETVRFAGLDANREFSFQGTKRWQLNYRFEARLIPHFAQGGGAAGWNHALRDDPAGGHTLEWQRINFNQGSIPFPTMDFDDLFKAETET